MERESISPYSCSAHHHWAYNIGSGYLLPSLRVCFFEGRSPGLIVGSPFIFHQGPRPPKLSHPAYHLSPIWGCPSCAWFCQIWRSITSLLLFFSGCGAGGWMGWHCLSHDVCCLPRWDVSPLHVKGWLSCCSAVVLLIQSGGFQCCCCCQAHWEGKVKPDESEINSSYIIFFLCKNWAMHVH